MLKKIALTTVGLIAVSVSAFADTTAVGFDSGSVFVYDQNTAAQNKLSGGTTADHDGFVLQLGYYSGATTTNNFAGTWIPLTGEGSANTAYNNTTIGDLNAEGGENGAFFIPGLNFTAGSGTTGNNLPAAGTPLSIRFYNAATIATSSFYNVVSDDAWTWKAPATPTSSVPMSLDDAGLEWLSISLGQAANTAFHTTVPTAAVPEPSTVALLIGGGLVGLVARRRRK